MDEFKAFGIDIEKMSIEDKRHIYKQIEYGENLGFAAMFSTEAVNALLREEILKSI